MEIKREGYLVTFDKLSESEKAGFRMQVADFIRIENAEMYSNVWSMPDGSYTIDIYFESDKLIKRFEEFLNEHGYALRITPKTVMVG